MFQFKDSMKIITIDQTYMKALYDACDQVFYVPSSYQNKPYIGILINDGNQKYAIPLTSAKERHKSWKNFDNGRFLIFEHCDRSKLGPGAIFTVGQDGSIKHILSALIVYKMIPIKDGVYQTVNINVEATDDAEMKKYKELLNKEYSFCLSIKDKIVKEAERIYRRQINTGKVYKGYCNFVDLEKVCLAF